MNTTKRLTTSAVLLALGLMLPFLTGQIQAIGNKLLPMHLPILVCGFVCGWKHGLITGFLTPLLRCVLFSMPSPINAVCMAFELATYGAISGYIYQKANTLKLRTYISLITAMISGRIVWGGVSTLICVITQTAFTWKMFVGGALLNAIPGMILQFILIPFIVLKLEKAGVINIEDN